jgi:hypothetical protein
LDGSENTSTAATPDDNEHLALLQSEGNPAPPVQLAFNPDEQVEQPTTTTNGSGGFRTPMIEARLCPDGDIIFRDRNSDFRLELEHTRRWWGSHIWKDKNGIAEMSISAWDGKMRLSLGNRSYEQEIDPKTGEFETRFGKDNFIRRSGDGTFTLQTGDSGGMEMRPDGTFIQNWADGKVEHTRPNGLVETRENGRRTIRGLNATLEDGTQILSIRQDENNLLANLSDGTQGLIQLITGTDGTLQAQVLRQPARGQTLGGNNGISLSIDQSVQSKPIDVTLDQWSLNYLSRRAEIARVISADVMITNRGSYSLHGLTPDPNCRE